MSGRLPNAIARNSGQIGGIVSCFPRNKHTTRRLRQDSIVHYEGIRIETTQTDHGRGAGSLMFDSGALLHNPDRYLLAKVRYRV